MCFRETARHWDIRLVIEVVSEGFEPRTKISFGKRRAHLEPKACVRPELAGMGKRSITASAVDTSSIGFFGLARRLKTGSPSARDLE